MRELSYCGCIPSERDFDRRKLGPPLERGGRLEMQGILIKPVGYQSGRSYPLVMWVHGGAGRRERLAVLRRLRLDPTPGERGLRGLFAQLPRLRRLGIGIRGEQHRRHGRTRFRRHAAGGRFAGGERPGRSATPGNRRLVVWRLHGGLGRLADEQLSRGRDGGRYFSLAEFSRSQLAGRLGRHPLRGIALR
jgi:hypothetical protein